MASTVSFAPVKKAVEKVIADTKVHVLKDFEKFVASKVDEESYESLKELFAEYNSDLAKLVVKLEDEVVGGKGKRKNKKGGDGEEKEKKALSPYNIFIRDTIMKLKTENPAMKGQELMKAATQAWTAHKAAGKV